MGEATAQPAFGRAWVRKTRRADLIARGLSARGVEQARLLALALDPESRAMLDEEIDKEHGATRDQLVQGLYPNVEDVVVGSGLHAAIYCSAKERAGGEPPLVLEQRARAGGVFALAREPVFFLNSRNRVDRQGAKAPGSAAALNLIPGGTLQPSDLSYREYQTQDALALTARVNLTLTANVVPSAKVIGVAPLDDVYEVELDTGELLLAERVIVATGLGEDRQTALRLEPSPLVLPFTEFVETMGKDTLFPLEGWRNVCVVGANDSGRVVVEYLLGQGPQPNASTASLDTVNRVTWIGQNSSTKLEFEECERSRYKGLGRFFPRDDPRAYARIRPEPGRALSVTQQAEGVRVRWRSDTGETRRDVFDHVVVCTGFEDQTNSFLSPQLRDTELFMLDGKPVAAQSKGKEVYKVGPAAQLPVTNEEIAEQPVLEQIPQNSAAIFRYAERTAALARWVQENAAGRAGTNQQKGRIK